MRGSADSGQATVEWVGLLLAVSLGLAALAGGVRGATGDDGGDEARGLGEAVAKRITCAARDLCGVGGRGARGGGRGAADRGPRDERLASPPPAPRRAPPRPPRAAPPPPSQRTGGGSLPNLGRAGGSIAQHAWLVCLGYRAMQDDLENPRTPREARPLDRTLDIVNECLNPWEFFFG
jgi:hypothetical protein